MKSLHGTYFTISHLPSSGHVSRPTCVCVITKKTAPHSVDRNLAKRRCRAVFRESAMSATDITSSNTFTIRIKPAALAAPYAQLKSEMVRLLKAVSHLHA